ncbi:MAG: hypothetical protein CMH52_10835 [Myxococcales bacterium]|nr:hypothetical protein [Myxococcales bacterium]
MKLTTLSLLLVATLHLPASAQVMTPILKVDLFGWINRIAKKSQIKAAKKEIKNLKRLRNCLVHSVTARLLKLGKNTYHHFVYDCPRYQKKRQGVTTYDPIYELLLNAYTNKKPVDIWYRKKSKDPLSAHVDIVARANIGSLQLDAKATKQNKLERTDCRVYRVEASDVFRRCWVKGCKNAPGELKLEAASAGVFQMCLTASMSKKRVKISFRDYKKQLPNVLTYIRYVDK